MNVTELSSVDLLRIRTAILKYLIQKYGPFPLAETVARHKQRELFSQKTAPKKWRKNRAPIPGI